MVINSLSTYAQQRPLFYLRSWLLRTKQLSMLRLGLWCCWSARKTRFCGTQPETIWFLWWRKLSRPKDTPLRVGCWTMGVRVFPKAWPWPVPAKRSSWSWFLLFSWSWLILIWMARNLKEKAHKIIVQNILILDKCTCYRWNWERVAHEIHDANLAIDVAKDWPNRFCWAWVLCRVQDDW